jgi:hypothetical protein
LIDPPHVAAINDQQVQAAAKTLGIRAIYSLNFKNDELERVDRHRDREPNSYHVADTIEPVGRSG